MLWCIQKTGWKDDWKDAMMPLTMPCTELCGDSRETLREVEKRVVASCRNAVERRHARASSATLEPSSRALIAASERVVAMR